MKKYVTFDKIEDLVHNFTLPYTNRGLIFKPLYSKFQEILYNFEEKNTKVQKTKELGEKKDDKQPKKVLVGRGSTIDSYVCHECEVFVRTLDNSLKLRELFRNQPVNKQFVVDCVWNPTFNLWELIVH